MITMITTKEEMIAAKLELIMAKIMGRSLPIHAVVNDEVRSSCTAVCKCKNHSQLWANEAKCIKEGELKATMTEPAEFE